MMDLPLSIAPYTKRFSLSTVEKICSASSIRWDCTTMKKEFERTIRNSHIEILNLL